MVGWCGSGGDGSADAQRALSLQGFRRVAGHDSHVRALKEMVMLPLVYPDLFQALQARAGPPDPRTVQSCTPETSAALPRVRFLWYLYVGDVNR